MVVTFSSVSISMQFDNSAVSNSAVNNRRQLRQEFQQLGQDLSSGDLAAAQSDYATLQSLMPQDGSTTSTSGSSSSSSSSSAGSALEQDFKQLGSDLQAGDLSAAQQDYAKLKQDFKSQFGEARSHGHHHHHQENGDGSQNGLSAVIQAFDQLGKALQSGDLSGVQQAFSALMQELQSFGQSGGQSSTGQSSTGQSSGSVSVSA